VNNGQMSSDFDAELERAMLGSGGKPIKLRLPPDVPQELDFAFAFAGRSVAVEIERRTARKSSAIF